MFLMKLLLRYLLRRRAQLRSSPHSQLTASNCMGGMAEKREGKAARTQLCSSPHTQLTASSRPRLRQPTAAIAAFTGRPRGSSPTQR